MDIRRFREELQNCIAGTVYSDEPMSRHTTWKIGGPADILLIPQGLDDCSKAVRLAKSYSIPYYIIGNGSNLLVRDNRVRGMVIRVSAGLAEITRQGNCVIAGAGVTLPTLARRAADYGLTGLEFAAGIPASIGGAVVMNAGAHGGSIGEVVEEVNILDPDGIQCTLGKADLDFRYRSSNLKTKGYIITGVKLGLEPCSGSKITETIQEYLNKRKERQPIGQPNAGSVFKNPPGYYAGKLIEEAGCKGLSVGGAQVSPKHANFIVNTNGATARDVLSLIELVQKAVFDKFGVVIEPEVQIIGE